MPPAKKLVPVRQKKPNTESLVTWSSPRLNRPQSPVKIQSTEPAEKKVTRSSARLNPAPSPGKIQSSVPAKLNEKRPSARLNRPPAPEENDSPKNDEEKGHSSTFTPVLQTDGNNSSEETAATKQYRGLMPSSIEGRCAGSTFLNKYRGLMPSSIEKSNHQTGCGG